MSQQTTFRLQPLHHGKIPSVQSRVFHREAWGSMKSFFLAHSLCFQGMEMEKEKERKGGKGKTYAMAAHILLARDKSHGQSASRLQRTLGLKPPQGQKR